jgi:hypothetical protein
MTLQQQHGDATDVVSQILALREVTHIRQEAEFVGLMGAENPIEDLPLSLLQ